MNLKLLASVLQQHVLDWIRIVKFTVKEETRSADFGSSPVSPGPNSQSHSQLCCTLLDLNSSSLAPFPKH